MAWDQVNGLAVMDHAGGSVADGDAVAGHTDRGLRSRYVIELTYSGSVGELRAVLKVLLRKHGLRCVRITPVNCDSCVT